MRIAFVGQKRVGKDTSFDILKDILNKRDVGITIRRFAFADAMKEILAELLEIPINILHDADMKEKPYSSPAICLQNALVHPRFEYYYKYAAEKYNVGVVDSAFKVATALMKFVDNLDPNDTRPRRHMQDFAETMRKEVDPFIWAILLEPQLCAIDKHQVAIITDVRHREEIEFSIRGHPSMVVLITRPTPSEDEHASEQMAKQLTQGDNRNDIDVVIDNDSDVSSLRTKLEKLADGIIDYARQHADPDRQLL